MTLVEKSNPLAVYAGVTPTRVRWSGIFAGTLAATVTYLALMLLGFAIGISRAPGSGSLGDIALPAAIWTIVSLLVSSYLGGMTAARAVGLHGHSRGRFNGLITGMIFLALITFGTSGLISSGLSAVTGVVSGVANTASSALGNAAGAVGGAANNAGGVQGLLNNLGLGDAYQSITSGLNEDELTQLISDAEPSLSQEQVSAAAGTVGNVVRAAGRNITGDLGNLSDIGGLVTRQVEGVTTALSGPGFVARLQSRGLTQPQAQEVAKVVTKRVEELRTQGQQAADAVAKTTREATQTAADTASRVAWLALLASGLVLLASTLGGGSGRDESHHSEVHQETVVTTNR